MRLWNARADGRKRVFARRDTAAQHVKGGHQIARQVIVPSVVAALHHDDVIAASHCPRQPNRLISRLTARIHQLDGLNEIDVLNDEPGQQSFQFGGSSSEQTQVQIESPPHRVRYIRIVMS